MSLKQLVDETTAALMDTIEDYEFSEKKKQAIQAVIEDSIVQAVKQVRKAHNEATVMCCGPEADMAHKIEFEAEQKINSLISNLSSLR
jgi:hypothetical protein